MSTPASPSEIAQVYRIALAHYRGDQHRARGAVEAWLRGLNEGAALRARSTPTEGDTP